MHAWRGEPAFAELADSVEQIRRQLQAWEERLHGIGHSLRFVQDSCGRTEERLNVQSQQVDQRLQHLEHRVELLEQRNASADTSLQSWAAGWWDELANMRREFRQGVEDLQYQLQERMNQLSTWQNGLQADVTSATSEAMQLCNRLADDSLSVSEAVQNKLDQLLDRTVVEHQPDAETDAEHQPVIESGALETASQEWAEELGGQICRLSAAVRRVIELQTEALQRQHESQSQVLEDSVEPRQAAGAEAAAGVPPSRMHPNREAAVQTENVSSGMTAASSPSRSRCWRACGRHEKLIELCEELCRLEACANARVGQRHSGNRQARHQNQRCRCRSVYRASGGCVGRGRCTCYHRIG